jgi:putative aldouronate transport system permease protein
MPAKHVFTGNKVRVAPCKKRTMVRMAIAAVGAAPIMIIYPFFQRYFVKGIVIGAVKG